MSLEIQTLRQLFALAPDAVAGLSDGFVAFLNPAAEALLSLREGDEAGAHLPDYILNEEAGHFVTTWQRKGESLDVTISRADNLTLLWCRPHGETPPPSPGWERALRELGDDLLTTRLALDAVIGGSKAELDPKLRQYAASLYQSYYRMKRLQTHMTLASGILDGRLPFTPHTILLDELCGELCDTVARLVGDMDIRLEYEADGAPISFTCDPRLMEIMLLNLISNSLLHTSAGDTVRVSLARRGKRLVLAVDDPGGGMPPSRLTELMRAAPDMALSDTATGAGMGLLIVRGIAERHGGAVIAESQEGKGTLLRVSLPLSDPAEGCTLRQPMAYYRTDGLNMVLTELSNILDKSFYNRKAFD